jgi:hypothetical protein
MRVGDEDVRARLGEMERSREAEIARPDHEDIGAGIAFECGRGWRGDRAVLPQVREPRHVCRPQ